MNDQSLDDELDLGVEKASAPWKKILIIALGVLLLIGIGIGAAYFIFVPSDENKSEEVVAQGGEAAKEEKKGPAVYQNFKPVFVVNLSPDGKRKAKMLQIGVQALMHNQELVDFLKHNDPMIRHHFLKLFGSRTASELESLEGKEKLQADLLEELQRVIDEQGGPGSVEAVFFTSFVLQ